MNTTSDTCPACGAIVVVPHTGSWVYCEQCREGKLRWRPDDLPTSEQFAECQAERLREDLKELEQWVVEGWPGAVRLAQRVKEQLKGGR